MLFSYPSLPLSTAYLSCFVSRSSTLPPRKPSHRLRRPLGLSSSLFFSTRAPFLSSFLFGALSVPRTGLAVCSEIRFGVVRAPRRTAPQSVHVARSAASESRAIVRARQISRARAASSTCPRRGVAGGCLRLSAACSSPFSTAPPTSPSPCNLVIERPRTARDGGPRIAQERSTVCKCWIFLACLLCRWCRGSLCAQLCSDDEMGYI